VAPSTTDDNNHVDLLLIIESRLQLSASNKTLCHKKLIK
jgi:hypothetical protein